MFDTRLMYLMKSLNFTFVLLLLSVSSSYCQTLQAMMKYVFIDGEAMGEYTGGIRVEKGIIKVGDTVKPKDEDGVEFSFRIVNIKDYDTNEEVQTLGANKDGFIVLHTLDKKKLSRYPKGSFYFGTAKPLPQDVPKVEIGTLCKVNGLEWKGGNYYNSSVYYPNGNSFMKTTQPYLTISFKSAQKPDDRQITLVHKNAKMGKGVLDKNNFEVLLSGSADGVASNSCLVSNWKNGKANTEKTDFYFEITKFEEKGDHVLVSAKYSGKLFGLNMIKGLIGSSCKDVDIQEGAIKDLKVSKY